MRKIWYILLLCVVVAAACKDEWDNYYGDSEDDRSAGAKKTIFEVLKEQKEHAKFVKLLEETGISKDLNSKRVLTLWLPEDKYLTDEIMQLDSIGKRRFILNHLNALALYKTKLSSKNEVETLAKKFIQIAGKGNNITVDKLRVIKFDEVCTNGVIHLVDGTLTPLRNVMEYLLESGNEYSIYRDSLLAYNDTVFRPDLSYPIGVNEVGQTIYDSVFIINNSLLKNVNFGNEKNNSTLFLASNEVIFNMLDDLKAYYEALGLSIQRSDTLACFEFLMKGSFLGRELTNLSGIKSITTSGGKVLRLDKQLISTNYEKCSNGVVYKFQQAYVPRGQFMKKVDFMMSYLYEVEGDRSDYCRFSYGGELNDRETDNADNITDNVFFDRNQPNWKFLSVKAEAGEWTDLVLLQKNLKGKIETAKLLPGKYKLSGWGYAWRSANAKLYLNGTPLTYGGTMDKYVKTGTFPLGEMAAFDYMKKLQVLCDTVEVGINKGNDVIRFESVGGGSKKDVIRIRELLFEPVGDNY